MQKKCKNLAYIGSTINPITWVVVNLVRPQKCMLIYYSIYAKQPVTLIMKNSKKLCNSANKGLYKSYVIM